MLHRLWEAAGDMLSTVQSSLAALISCQMGISYHVYLAAGSGKSGSFDIEKNRGWGEVFSDIRIISKGYQFCLPGFHRGPPFLGFVISCYYRIDYLDFQFFPARFSVIPVKNLFNFGRSL